MLFAGIDAGQTSTTAAIAGDDGRTIAFGYAGPADEIGADAQSTQLRDALEGALADAVRKGRREEFKAAYAAHGEDIPDPLDRSTFQSAKLDWGGCASAAGQQRLALIRDLLRSM